MDDDHIFQPFADLSLGAKQDEFTRMVNGERVSDLQPDLFTGGMLREYQVKGFTWMKNLFENGINGREKKGRHRFV